MKPTSAAKAKETEEKRQGEQRSTEKFFNYDRAASKQAKTGFPIYLIAILLILGIVAGAAITLTLTKQQPAPQGNGNGNQQPPINDVAYRTVPITMLYSNACKSCRQTNTFEELLKVRGIPYSMKKVDVNSDEGRKIVDKFGIGTVPTAIIDADKIQYYPTTKKDFDSTLVKIGTAYIAPEFNLNQNIYYPIYFLDASPIYCAAGKPKVIAFDDYYTKQNAVNRVLLYDFIKDFNKGLDFRYSFAQSASIDENAVLGNIFLTCAGEQNKYPEFERAMTGIYCNNPFKGDESILTLPEITGCWTISNHYGKPLSPIELDIALDRSKLDKNAFLACIAQKDAIYKNSKRGFGQLLTNKAGIFLLDCRETTDAKSLRENFCKRHPETENCSAAQTPD